MLATNKPRRRHPWRDRLEASRQQTPSEYLARRHTPLLKGHGLAWENAYHLGYDCPCGMSARAPHDDSDGFWADVTVHEAEHAEAVS